LPGGTCTHWKAPPLHGARQKRSFAYSPMISNAILPVARLIMVA
jgi:hypothetical protein